MDRIRPRGIRNEDAHLHEWIREVAPSTKLRRWYAHDPDRHAEFRRRYLAELHERAGRRLFSGRHEAAGHARVTLVTAARYLERSQAAVIAQLLNGRRQLPPDPGSGL